MKPKKYNPHARGTSGLRGLSADIVIMDEAASPDPARPWNATIPNKRPSSAPVVLSSLPDGVVAMLGEEYASGPRALCDFAAAIDAAALKGGKLCMLGVGDLMVDACMTQGANNCATDGSTPIVHRNLRAMMQQMTNILCYAMTGWGKPQYDRMNGELIGGKVE